MFMISLRMIAQDFSMHYFDTIRALVKWGSNPQVSMSSEKRHNSMPFSREDQTKTPAFTGVEFAI
jgi:hypothetical protein